MICATRIALADPLADFDKFADDDAVEGGFDLQALDLFAGEILRGDGGVKAGAIGPGLWRGRHRLPWAWRIAR